MKTIALDQMIDEYIGKKGTKELNLFDAQVEVERVSMKIYNLRKEKGLSKKELAKLAGISRAQISRIEKDIVRVKIIQVLKVLNVLEIEENLIWYKKTSEEV
ncbi:transcriptional regulator [Myroides marinus]|uniref:helix-turn-helix domain-containing protein n=1 Tax=Myroides marinus TaxID=703342 RepID=UPI000742357B|nr:helix-turn-helix transcriptional regulator [Myroides marinus]KUF38638.1 transcriptional regulator [Myroides marinus]